MLRVDIQSAPPFVTLICSGRIVLGVEAETLRCMATSRPERHLSLQLSQVHAIDAAGLGLLVELQQWAQSRRGILTIANPSPRVLKLIMLTRLHRVLHLSGLSFETISPRDPEEWQIMTA